MELEDLAGVLEEDIYAWEAVQDGLHSRFAPRGRYAPSEVVLVRFNEWLIEKYRTADALAQIEQLQEVNPEAQDSVLAAGV